MRIPHKPLHGELEAYFDTEEWYGKSVGLLIGRLFPFADLYRRAPEPRVGSPWDHAISWNGLLPGKEAT